MLRRNNINNNNTTFILEDMRTIMRVQQRDISSIKNTSSAQVEALTQMGNVLSKVSYTRSLC
jgi:predicted DNA binding CopG/RHH family protein